MSTAPQELRILVADDEEDILELLGEYLRARGYAVHTASDGQDALNIVRGGNVDIVLTDMKMPTLNGLELLNEISENPHPVATIVMTGFGTIETAMQAMKSGAHDYLLKPFKLRDVHAALIRAANQLQMQRQVARSEDILGFYEMALALTDKQGMRRLLGTLAAVAQRELMAQEVAVWIQGPSGWEAAARGGTIGALANLDPESLLTNPSADGGLVFAPIEVNGSGVAVLALAGVGSLDEGPRQRLSTLVRAVSEAWSRVG